LGRFVGADDWLLPDARGTLVFVGSQLMLTKKMALSSLRSGRLRLVCKINGRFSNLSLYRFLLWQLGERIHGEFRRLPEDGVLRRSLYSLATTKIVKALWDKFFQRAGLVVPPVGGSGLSGDDLYRELVQRSVALPLDEKINPVKNRVLLINAGLAAGGAERQIVNTLIGLRDSGRCESVGLLAEYMDYASRLDFFSHELDGQGIEIAQVRRTLTLAEDGLSSLPMSIAEVAADLPPDVLEEILNLVEEFRDRCPSVVHAWQDSTSIKAGIAAAIAGVPCIVLASRNVVPTNFEYYRDYMRSAYRALASLESVTFINNSEAGSTDYIRWLGIATDRFRVLRNGVNLRHLQRANADAVSVYRQSLGIPSGAMIIGSVFRFWQEKRPMLWLQSAACLAQRHPDVHFLVIGEGPLRRDMEAFVVDSNLMGKIHLPGARPDVALPLSAMSMFLLTSEYEGTPNVVLEAQWLGLPVVVTDAGGAREAFDHGNTGRLAAKAQAEHIANIVSDYLEDKEAMDLARVQGPQFVQRVFGLERMVQETLHLYQFETGE
jgi:glycosyltransferase involved in cell wall biosynthesis